MNHTKISEILTVLFAVVLCFVPVGLADPVGTAFTYQGKLIVNNQPADGCYDFQFKLFNAISGGGQVDGTIFAPDVEVVDGYFTLELDFGEVFDGNSVWLEIGVRPCDQNDPNHHDPNYTVLNQRQYITAVPYSYFAKISRYAWDSNHSNLSDYSKESGHSLTSDYSTESGHSLWSDKACGLACCEVEGKPLVVYVDSACNVGIGTLNPAAKLDIAGQVKITDGTQGAGKVLTSNSDGLATWQTPAPDSDWIISGNNMYSGVTGNVGIGTPNPSARLDVIGEIHSSAIKVSNGTIWASGGAGHSIYGEQFGTFGYGVHGEASNSDAGGANIGGYFETQGGNGCGVYGKATHPTGINYGVYGQTIGSNGYAGYFVGGKNYFQGNVGIGTPTPQSKLDVQGQVKITDGTQAAGRVLTSNVAGLASWQPLTETDPTVTLNKLKTLVSNDFHNLGGTDQDIHPTNTEIAAMGYIKSYTETDPKVGTLTINYLPKWDGSKLADGTIYDNGGNVGVGTSSPTAKLDVVGQVKITDGSQGAGKVLTSNDVGLASWQNLSGITDSDWTISGINMYSGVSGNVGVGTSSPTAKLDVSGQVKITDGSQGAGKVLTSNDVGLASWQLLTETDPKVGTLTISYLPKWDGTQLANSTIYDNGNVGIGTSSPATKLDVAGVITSTGGSSSNWNTAYSHKTTEDAINGLVKGNGSGTYSAVMDNSTNWTAAYTHKTTEDVINGLVKCNGAGVYSAITDNSANWNAAFGWGNHADAHYLTTEVDPKVGTLTISYLPKWDGTKLANSTIYDNGNVGVGTTSPTAKLDVAGQVKITDGSQGAGKVLTSNDVGLASWQNLSGITDSDWTISGINMYSGVSGNVGVGTSSPTAKLDVSGQVKITDGSQGAGKVLTSNDVGLASWQLLTETDPKVGTLTISYLPKWDGTQLANSTIYDNGNVGIGMPPVTEAKLKVGGNIAASGTISASTSLSLAKSVSGEATDVTGTNYGGYFKAAGSNGFGVYGEASSSSGITYGGYFKSAGGNGFGVYGEATGISGTNFGGYFRAAGGDNAAGVYGMATNAGDYANYGGYFQTAGGNDAAGVYGVATNATSTFTNYGGYFRAAGGNGAAGVYGEATGNSGRGVYGVASASGANYGYGVYGETTNSNGYAGYFTGGRNYFQGNVGIGTTSPGAKLEVAGQVKITGGSPGVNKVLTSDISGLASWATPASGDNLGNHTATQNIILGAHWLSGDGGNEGVYVSSGGNVGIGTSSPDPTAKLDVAGQVKITDGSQGSGKVLTSDSSGLASWQTLTTGGDITAVNAGTGLSGGGTSGDVTLAVSVPLSLTGSVASSGAVINATNTGTGYGVMGTSASGNYGYLGGSTYSVYGYSVGGSGVAGTSNSGYGVYGASATGYAGYFSGNVYVTNNVSALSYTDRTPYPKDLATAYQAVMSMERLPDGQYNENDKEKQLDHSKLSDFIRSKDGNRDLSATVSCQNEVIKDLIRQNKELSKRLEALEQKQAERMVK